MLLVGWSSSQNLALDSVGFPHQGIMEDRTPADTGTRDPLPKGAVLLSVK
jgi:hypothetical protein